MNNLIDYIRWRGDLRFSQDPRNRRTKEGGIPMNNLIDYIRWRGDLRFSQDPPNAVDALVFSGLSYVLSAGGAICVFPRTRPMRWMRWCFRA